DGAIGWMIFNSPERRNAVSLEMWQAMPLILDAFEADSAVRVIILRGAGGRAFVSGADISQFEEQRAAPEAIARYDAIAAEAGRRLAATDKPTIAMIEGYCIGGGVGIAVGCDLRLAAEGAKFGVPATRLGLGYGPAGVKKLLDLVGPAHVKEIFYTARHFSAAEAQAMGLVNRVRPEADLEAYVRDYARMIAEGAPLTGRAVKRTVEELLRASPEADFAFCEALVAECFASADYIEGRRAFMEKRRPAFTGR
ncbi:MAG: enoyl-CoA hydratase/isomerase family protein, partial [Rhodospirillales bacterium]|nr:enoyl-CoA hydratase/isomerase family protein [Rhodospirillales bacterium]